MTYRTSVRANADIEAICDYISKNNPSAASQLDEQIRSTLILHRLKLKPDVAGAPSAVPVELKITYLGTVQLRSIWHKDERLCSFSLSFQLLQLCITLGRLRG